MKQLATGYTFNAAARTITFTGTVPASLESILSVTNATTGTLLFLPQGGAALTGTWSSPVLTLAASTTGMANGDRLQILFEDGAATTPVSDGGGSLTVDGPLTDAQLRASAVPVSGALTDTQLRATAVPVSGPLTDTQIRASALPVSDGGGSLTVDGGVTANAGTNLNTSALALEAGGNLAGVRADLGTDGSSPPTLPGGSTGVRGWLRYMTSLWPSLVSGRWPVVSNITLGSGVLDATTQRVTLATDGATATAIGSIDTKTPALGVAAPSGSQPVVLPNRLFVTGAAGLSALNTNLLTGNLNDWLDVSAYAFGNFSVRGSAGISAGQIQLWGTDDPVLDSAGVEVSYARGFNSFTALAAGVVSVAASSTVRMSAYLPYRFIQLRVTTAFTGGTVQASYSLSQLVPPALVATQNLSFIQGNFIPSRGAAVATAPLVIGQRGATAAPTAVSNGQVVDMLADTWGRQIIRPFSIPELCWSYAAASGGITGTSNVEIASAPGAGLRRYITGLTISNNSGVATEVLIRDGATTVIRRLHVLPNAENHQITFPCPLSASVNTALNVACVTAGAAVYVNADGFTAP